MSSDSEESTSESDILYNYLIAELISKGRRTKKYTHIVPSSWVTYDPKRGKCTTKYIEKPYAEEDIHMVNELVQNKSDPPEGWPTYGIKIKGRAMTYKEALEKLEKLNTEENVLTHASDESSSEAQQKIENQIRRNKLLSASDKLKASLNLLSVSEQNNPDPKNKQLEVSQKKRVIENKTSQVKKLKANDGSQTKITNSVQSVSSSDHNNLTEAINSLPSTSTTMQPAFAHALPEPNLSAIDSENTSSHPQDFSNNVMIDLNLPLIQLDTSVNDSDFQEFMRSNVYEIKQSLNLILANQKAVAAHIIEQKANTLVRAETEFIRKYNLTLPFIDMQDFKIFDNNLRLNNAMKNEFCVDVLPALLDANYSITKSMVNILKKFISKSIAIQYSAVKQSGNKPIFKQTKFYDCMADIIAGRRESVTFQTTEKDLNKALSDVLCNAQNWNKSKNANKN